jgi:hypothetical protein
MQALCYGSLAPNGTPRNSSRSIRPQDPLLHRPGHRLNAAAEHLIHKAGAGHSRRSSSGRGASGVDLPNSCSSCRQQAAWLTAVGPGPHLQLPRMEPL